MILVDVFRGFLGKETGEIRAESEVLSLNEACKKEEKKRKTKNN